MNLAAYLLKILLAVLRAFSSSPAEPRISTWTLIAGDWDNRISSFAKSFEESRF